MFSFAVEVMHDVFSHVPITELQNTDTLVQVKPTEFHESWVQYFILYMTSLLLLWVYALS
jgi:hypothetical protein